MTSQNKFKKEEDVLATYGNWFQFEREMKVHHLTRFGEAGEEIILEKPIDFLARRPDPKSDLYELKPTILSKITSSDSTSNKIKKKNNFKPEFKFPQ